MQQVRRKQGAVLLTLIHKYFSPLLLLGWHLLFVLAGATPDIYPADNLAESHIKGSRGAQLFPRR
jgi:hypothetical protein